VYPVALSVRGRRAVVAGGGDVAERAIRGLLDAGAAVVVVAPDVTGPIAAHAAAGSLTWHARPYEPGDLAGAFVAFAASDDARVNAAVATDSHGMGILLHDAFDPQRGDFAAPAVHRAGDLTVAVDAGGLPAGFAQRVRDELAITFDARYARAAATLAALDARTSAVVQPERRAAVMRHFAERDLEELAAMPPGAVEHEVERTAETLAGVVPRADRALVCATRGSALALVQARAVMASLAAAGRASTILTLTTRGDAIRDRSIAAIGSDNVFVTELEQALRDGRADYAVHSAKDLPSTLAPDMVLAAVTAREDARDAFCSERFATFDALPRGARVGTSSPRRRAQLRALRPDLVYDDVRGNVDTRLRKLRDGEYDAIVLACAGLNRLGVAATHTVPFAVDRITPAIGQGTLGIETRAGDPLAETLARALEDPAASLAVRAERAFLRTLRGGCQAPIGCHGRWEHGRLRLAGAIAAPDGARVLRRSSEDAVDPGDVAAAEEAGVALAHALLADGGASLLGAGPLSGHLFLLPDAAGNGRIAPALRDAGAEVVEARDSAAASAALGTRVPTAILFPSSGAVTAIGEYLRTLRDRGVRPAVAAVGAASRTAADHGWPPDVTAAPAEPGALVQTVTRYVLETGA
jgi:hydroxymethylbilane synthase